MREYLQNNIYLCLLKSEFCQVQCQQKCENAVPALKIKEQFSQKKRKATKQELACNKCKDQCQQATGDICVGNDSLNFVAISKEAFYTFRSDWKKCQNVGFVCSKLCYSDYCQDSFSAQCAKCKVDCDEGAKSGCFISVNEKQEVSFK